MLQMASSEIHDVLHRLQWHHRRMIVSIQRKSHILYFYERHKIYEYLTAEFKRF